MSYDRRYDPYAQYYQQYPVSGRHGYYAERPPSNGSYQGGQHQTLSAYQTYAPHGTLPNSNLSSNTMDSERSTGGNSRNHQSAQDAGSGYSQGHLPASSMNHGQSAHTPAAESNHDRYAPNSAARISYPSQRTDHQQHVWRENNQTASHSVSRYVPTGYESSIATSNYQQGDTTRSHQSSQSGGSFSIPQTSQHPQERKDLPRPEYQQMRSSNEDELQQAHPRETNNNAPLMANTSSSVQNGKNLSSYEHNRNPRYSAPQAQMSPNNVYQSPSQVQLAKEPTYPPEQVSSSSTAAPVSRQTPRDHQLARQIPNKSHVSNSNESPNSMAHRSPIPDVQTNNQITGLPLLENPARPTTVDPRSILNHQEYHRQQDTGAEKRRATNAMNTDDSGRTSRLSNQSPAQEVAPPLRTGVASPASSASGMKDQMELEMKQMIDRMREYKAKDPALFSQIWEHVKKGQPSQAVPSQAQALAPSASPSLDQQKFPSPPARVSPERAETESQSSFPPSLDRGRFPQQRRRRGGRMSVVASRQDKSGSEETGNTGQITPLPTHGQSQPGPTLHATSASTDRSTSNERLPLANESREKPTTEKATNPRATWEWPAARERDITEERLVAAMAEYNKPIEALRRPFDDAPPPHPRPQSLLPGPRRQPEPPKPPGPSGSSGLSAASGQAPVPHALPRPQPDIRTSGEGSKPKIGSTVWPEHKKEALAAAAANVLNAHYGKNGLTISPVSVHYLLDQNPSYAQLCELLEKRGFAIDRGFFARTLISAVPDLSSTSNAKTSRLADRPPPTAEAPSRLTSEDPRSSNGPSKSIQEPVELSPKSVSKHDKARKRNFSEIIDLSQDRSDDEDVNRHPGPHVPSKSSSSPLPKAAGNGVAIRPSRREYLRKEVIVQPLNKRRDAFRRSSYDPRTICEDFLIACGKHPTEAPLNAHLNILRERFDSVNDESDLSTLRWDLLDPEEDDLEDSESDEAETSLHNMNDEDPEPELSFVKEEAVREDPVPKSSSSNRHPSITIQISSNTTPARRSIPSRDPGSNSQDNASPLLKNTEQQSKPLATSLDKAAFIRSYSFTPAATSEVPNGTPNPPSSSLPSPYATAKSVRVPGRVGRPPGAKNRHPRSDKGVPKKRPMQFETTGMSSPSKPNTPASAAAKETLALRRPNASNPSAGISIVLPTRSPSVAQSHSSFLHRQRMAVPNHHNSNSSGGRGGIDEAPFSALPPKTFEALKCRWEGCPAELHNLETLWKHIRKHRTRLEKPYTCKWAGCAIGGDGGGGNGVLRFRTHDMEAWDRHMETEHLRSFARAG